MSNPNRPFGVPPDDDDLERELKTDAPSDADALDAWLNEIAHGSGLPGPGQASASTDQTPGSTTTTRPTPTRWSRRRPGSTGGSRQHTRQRPAPSRPTCSSGRRSWSEHQRQRQRRGPFRSQPRSE